MTVTKPLKSESKTENIGQNQCREMWRETFGQKQPTMISLESRRTAKQEKKLFSFAQILNISKIFNSMDSNNITLYSFMWFYSSVRH